MSASSTACGPTSLMVAEVGPSTWKPLSRFRRRSDRRDRAAAPEPVAEDTFDALATPTRAADRATRADAARRQRTDEGVFAACRPARAIHAGFWRRCAALIIDSTPDRHRDRDRAGCARHRRAWQRGRRAQDAGALVGSMFLIFAARSSSANGCISRCSRAHRVAGHARQAGDAASRSSTTERTAHRLRPRQRPLLRQDPLRP